MSESAAKEVVAKEIRALFVSYLQRWLDTRQYALWCVMEGVDTLVENLAKTGDEFWKDEYAWFKATAKEMLKDVKHGSTGVNWA